MKITPNSPELTAYALGELSEDIARKVEHAALVDPGVNIALREIERTCAMLNFSLADEYKPQLYASQRRAIFRALAEEEERKNNVSTIKSRRKFRLLASAAMAAAIAIGFVSIQVSRTAVYKKDGVVSLPLPGAGTTLAVRPVEVTSPGIANQEFPQISRQTGSFENSQIDPSVSHGNFSNAEVLQLPLVLNTGGAVWVKRWLQEKQALPPKSAVRIEELVNALDLPISQRADAIQWGVEQGACPWNENGRLIAVKIQSEAKELYDVEVFWNSRSNRRMVNSFADSKSPNFLPKQNLSSGEGTVLLLEMESATAMPGTLLIRWEGGSQKINLQSTASEGGSEFQQIAAWAAFGHWLRGERGVSSATVKAAISAPNPSLQQDRELIEKSLKLRQ